ncbi:hypothetical protein KPH14_005905 [Odynerus spinipes]|uniref:FK506-binding protein 15 n=1 Tax=Odynerus spinipes TaxID=1348599 RepID=A0AAD9RKD8_9HYME|nr:hypothetical protein KPH14_005905 [Odynerus spinipes]
MTGLVDDQLPNIEKIFANDDEDFIPGSGSNLAAIFGYRTKDQDIPNIIKPTGQKKPSNKQDSSLTQSLVKTEVIAAKAIHAYKLQNGQYTSIGKLGIALTGNVSARLYQIILYKTKQEYVSIVTVTREFTYTVQTNNYSTYYDNNNENWSILFESNDACIEFAREIGLARYFSKLEKIEDVIYQDLTATAKDNVAKEGSSVSIKYYISTDIVQPYKISSISFQTMIVNISMDDNWEKTLIGTSKGLRRILILPSSKQISLGPGFPKDKDIMMEIEVINIQELEETYSLSKPVVTGKASLLSRMAKMGQSILPKIPASTTTDSEDTEDDSPQKSPRHKKLESLGVSLQKKQVAQEISDNAIQSTCKVVESKNDVPSTNPVVPKPLIPASALSPAWPPSQLQPNYMTLNGQMYSLPQPISQAVPTVMDPNLNMLLSETRMANAELRMGMSKITDNVQRVLDKLHALELQNASSTKDTSMEDTLKLLLTMNMSQSGVRDMELLKKTDVGKDACCEHLSELSRVKKEITDLGNEIKYLKESLAKSMESVKTLEEEKLSLLRVNKDLQDKIQNLDVSLSNANDQLHTKLTDLEKLKVSQNEYEKENTELKDKISKITADCAVIGIDVESSKQKDKENKDKEIKHIMNKTYLTLMESFTNESYSSDYIKSVIASTIKNITLQVLQETSEKNENRIYSYAWCIK